MIAHLVLFRFKSGPGQADERLREIAQAMDELPDAIPAIVGWQHGCNLTADDDAWDYGLFAQFRSRDDLQSYFEHPAHVALLERWYEVAELRFADFETPQCRSI